MREVAAITRATLRRTVSSPAGLVLGAACLAAWPLYASLAPLGIGSQTYGRESAVYEFAFMAGAMGVSLSAAARKELAPWIEACRTRIGASADTVAIAASGFVMALLCAIPPMALARAGGSGFVRALPLLAVASAWGALAVRIAPQTGAAGWITALGSFALPALLPETYLLPRAASAAGACLLGAWLIDHTPEGHAPEGHLPVRASAGRASVSDER